ncbi:MAG TPA: hypothetical protein VF832_01610 [Longimicrobiales bacterium]
MSNKVSEVLSRIIGGGLLLGSVGFLSHAMHTPEYLVSGLVFFGGGFWLAARRDSSAAAELEAQQHIARLDESVTATQAELAAMQERLERLALEHDFMRQLAAPGGSTSASGASPPPPSGTR